MTTPHLQSYRSSPPSSNEPIALAPSMIEAVSRAHAFAPAATPIVLYGESGTGKTFFADYIHRLSGRVGSMIAFSVGMLAPQLALDELFGHVRGAYTDARSMRAGLLATAGAGTLLLDDVHTLDLGVQKQLLQVLDRGTYSPVGSDRVMTVACRVVLAMTESPEILLQRGQLLKDLRYRLGACEIRIPPLRERRAEVSPLAKQALADCVRRTGVEGPSRFTEAALRALNDGDYNGNVRQLNAAIEHSYLIARAAGRSEIGPEHLPTDVCPTLLYKRHGDPTENWAAVERAMMRTGNNAKQAARLLGISRTTLNSLLAAKRAGPRSSEERLRSRD